METKTKIKTKIKIEKVTVNVGAGESGEKLDKAKDLVEKLTKRKAVYTKARKREQAFKIRKGQDIGVKVTLRKSEAEDFLKNAFKAVDNKIKEKSFDDFGNVSFGVPEYIDFPGMKYDPKIGLIGFDVCITLARPGLRVKKRKRKKSKIPKKQFVKKDESIDFLTKNFGIEVTR